MVTKTLRTSLLYLSSSLLASFPTISMAQDSLSIFRYPSAREIVVSVKAQVQPFGNRFIYRYELISSTTSKQDVWIFELEKHGEVESVETPVGWNVDFAPLVIPRVSWGSNDSVSQINPGNRLSGFAFSSRGLPTLIQFYAAGWVEIPTFPEGEEPDSIAGDDVLENSIRGITVGPVLPPEPFVVQIFLDTLISYKHQTFSLGWLGDKNFVKELDNHLDNARKHLEKGDSAKCGDEVSKFQERIQKEREKTKKEEAEGKPRSPRFVTSEGYGLLYFNAQYLIDRLPQKKGK